jgi:putative restriction endonuclease
MKAFIGVTDFDWYSFLSTIQGLDEVNFWQPSASSQFKALQPGQPFLFKLHSPRNYIVGGGFFAHSTILPVSLAWASFAEKNGARTLKEMRSRIEKYRRSIPRPTEDYEIGCILLEQPFFLRPSDWIPAPSDWSPNIVRGKGYDTTIGEGNEIWEAITLRLDTGVRQVIRDEGERYGPPVLVTPRLGQGSFRIMVTDAYARRCAVTSERTLPVLDAAHIKPYVDSGPHDVRNGILLRSDIHKLFDTGYVTVADDYRFEVSRRIREEYENGRDYYALNGKKILLPPTSALWPDKKYIHWHNENVYKG